MLLNRYIVRLAPLLVLIAASLQASGAPMEPVWSLVQKEKPRVLDTLKELVAIESGSSDIEGLDKIAGVMVNGRLYDPVTMNETGTGDRVRPPYYWE